MRYKRSAAQKLGIHTNGTKYEEKSFDGEYMVRHDSFMAMLNSSLSGERFNVESVINDWWVQAFLEPYQGGLTLENATLMIEYKLISDDAHRFGVILTDTFYQNCEAILERRESKLSMTMFKVLHYLKESEVRQQIIQKEPTMARVVKQAPTAAAVEIVEPEKAAKGKLTKEQRVDLIADLLMKRNKTDVEIADEVNVADGLIRVSPTKVKGVRNYMNKNAAALESEYKGLSKKPIVEVIDEPDPLPETEPEPPVVSAPKRAARG
jgi:hypothetical protein